MSSLFSKASDLCKTGKPFALAVVIGNRGSSPRKEGSKMIVTNGEIAGTIGGGLLEALTIRKARENVIPSKSSTILAFDMSGSNLTEASMVCGGSQEVLVAFVEPTPDNALVFDEADRASKAATRAWLLYIIDSRPQSHRSVSILLNVKGEALIGTPPQEALVEQSALMNPIRLGVHDDVNADVRYIADPIMSAGTLFLFGGGHVSKEVASLACRLGFNVTVIDDRSEFANTTRFPDCTTVVVNSFADLPELDINNASCILIITRGHAYDAAVLEWAIDKNAFYLGMIGSKRKRDLLYARLRQQGIANEQLARVHCPVGLEIGAETPAEIAVSIMGEIIAERSKARITSNTSGNAGEAHVAI